LPDAAGIEFISFLVSRTENSFKTLAESEITRKGDSWSRAMLNDGKVICEPEANRRAQLRLDVELIQCRGLRARLSGIDRFVFAVDNIAVNSIFDEATPVLSSE
jgi:hypothetical protein